MESTGIHIDETISLLDPRNGLMPRDLIVLFFELQKHYKIKFVEQDIIANRFDYLDNIVKAVEDKKIHFTESQPIGGLATVTANYTSKASANLYGLNLNYSF